MAFSLPAAVGFIALGGIAVLNGVVMASEVRRRLDLREPLATAISGGCAHVLRAVLTTAVVAALGFLPMATATSAGAEPIKTDEPATSVAYRYAAKPGSNQVHQTIRESNLSDRDVPIREQILCCLACCND